MAVRKRRHVPSTEKMKKDRSKFLRLEEEIVMWIRNLHEKGVTVLMHQQEKQQCGMLPHILLHASKLRVYWHPGEPWHRPACHKMRVIWYDIRYTESATVGTSYCDRYPKIFTTCIDRH